MRGSHCTLLSFAWFMTTLEYCSSTGNAMIFRPSTLQTIRRMHAAVKAIGKLTELFLHSQLGIHGNVMCWATAALPFAPCLS